MLVYGPKFPSISMMSPSHPPADGWAELWVLGARQGLEGHRHRRTLHLGEGIRIWSFQGSGAGTLEGSLRVVFAGSLSDGFFELLARDTLGTATAATPCGTTTTLTPVKEEACDVAFVEVTSAAPCDGRALCKPCCLNEHVQGLRGRHLRGRADAAGSHVRP